MKITKRKNGYWYLRKSRTDIRSLGTKDKTEAKQLLAIEKEKAKALMTGDVDRLRGISLVAFMDEYLEHRMRLVSIGELAIKTYKLDEQALKRLLGAVGDLPLRQVAGKVDTFKVKLLAGASDIEKRKNTINTYIRHLSSAFSWAASPDRATDRPAYIELNPFRETRTEAVKFRGIQRLPRYLGKDELNTLRRQLNGEIMDLRTKLAAGGSSAGANAKKSLVSKVRLGRMMEFYLYTGMRAAELTGLSWGNVRLQEGVILLSKTKGRKERMVPIAPSLATLIRQMGPRDLGRLFPISPEHVSDMFRELVRRSGLVESKCLHGLRHSFGTLAADSGMDLDVIQHIMGHQSIKTTEKYKDVLDSRKAEQMKGVCFA